MPAVLPFAPQSCEYTFVRPRTTHVSDFTGAEQQVFSGYPYYRGSMTFAPNANDEQVGQWRRFCSLAAEDGTFYAPLYSAGSERVGPVDVTPFPFQNLTLLRMTIRLSDVPQGIMRLPEAGDVVQVRSKLNPAITECILVRRIDNNGVFLNMHFHDTSLLTYSLASAGLALEAIWGQPEVRGLVVNEDYDSVLAINRNTVDFSVIEWTEAIGSIAADIAIATA